MKVAILLWFGIANAGLDVKAVVEVCPGVSDHEVMRLGIQEGRVLLTEDKDFGWLVFAGTAAAQALIFISSQQNKIYSPETIVEFVKQRAKTDRNLTQY